MSVKLRVIDNRNQLFGIMQYQAICSLPLFFETRAWCWEHWGPGIEYEHFKNYVKSTGQVPKWVFDCAKYQGASISNGKIYLPDDNHMKSLFVLTWL